MNIEKVGSYWNCEAYIAEEFFQYSHPFLFLDFIDPKSTKHQIELQFKFIQIFTSKENKKIFDIQDFLENFPSKLN